MNYRTHLLLSDGITLAGALHSFHEVHGAQVILKNEEDVCYNIL